MTRPLGITMVALAVIGLCAIPLFDASIEQRVSPLHSALPVAAKEFTTSTLAFEPGYHYEFEISVANSVPYADCLLGAGSDAISGDCRHHPSVIDLTWSLRDDRRHVVASGKSPGDVAMFGYGGDDVDVVLGYISVLRPTNARLTVRYRRSAVALAPLRPSMWIYDQDAAEGFGIRELFFALFCVALCVAGGIILVASSRRFGGRIFGQPMERIIPLDK